MDIKAKIDEIVTKVKSDKDIAKKFKDNPQAVVEDIAGVDLPDGALDKIIDGVKAKVSLDSVKSKLGGLFK